MAPRATPVRPLIDDRLAAMLGLIDQADTVELKLTVPETNQRSAVRALGMDPLEAQIRQVFFFDTPDLALDKAGLVVRARRVQGRGDDTVVKLRPVVPDELPKGVRDHPSFGVEVDAMPGGFVCSGSMKAALGSGDGVKAVVAGERPLRKLLTKEQRALFADHAPEGVTLDDLVILGPIPVFKLKLAPKDLGRKLVVELWLYPDGSRIVELSTKCLPPEAIMVALQAKQYLTAKGVDLSGHQQTKTRTALNFFTKEIRAAIAAGEKAARAGEAAAEKAAPAPRKPAAPRKAATPRKTAARKTAAPRKTATAARKTTARARPAAPPADR
ncbi:MAG: adenylate cyclase [Thermoleophilia bacterium]